MTLSHLELNQKRRSAIARLLDASPADRPALLSEIQHLSANSVAKLKRPPPLLPRIVLCKTR